jgi:hypothetical protein
MDFNGYSSTKRRKITANKITTKQLCIQDAFCLPTISGTEGDVLTAGSGLITSWQTPILPPVEKWPGTSSLARRTIENNALELRLTFFVLNLTIPANSLKIGDSFKITSTGRISAQSNSDIATYRLKLGGPTGTVIAGNTPFVLNIGNTLQYYKIETILTVRSLGTNAIIASTTSYDYSGNRIGQYNIAVVNTEIDQAFASTWEWVGTGTNKIIEQEIWTAQQIV